MIEDVHFLTVEEVVEIHADQIYQHGGDRGVRDLGLLASAVHAAQNVAAYAEASDLCDMAAAYVFHIAENQPFVDGNKRAALASGLVFLYQNGVAVDDPDGLLYDVMVGDRDEGDWKAADRIDAALSVGRHWRMSASDDIREGVFVSARDHAEGQGWPWITPSEVH